MLTNYEHNYVMKINRHEHKHFKITYAIYARAHACVSVYCMVRNICLMLAAMPLTIDSYLILLFHLFSPVMILFLRFPSFAVIHTHMLQFLPHVLILIDPTFATNTMSRKSTIFFSICSSAALNLSFHISSFANLTLLPCSFSRVLNNRQVSPTYTALLHLHGILYTTTLRLSPSRC